MRRRLPAPWAGPRKVSRAVLLLRDAPVSPCPSCGRVTKTTTDGVCADCWAHKDGGSYHRAAPPPRWAMRVASLLRFRSRSHPR